MNQRDVTDAVVFIALGTFIATYAMTLISAQNPGERLRWFGGRRLATVRSPVSQTLTLVGVFSAVWGGTGLQHHTNLLIAGLIAIGPTLVLQAVVVLAHNRRVPNAPEPTTPSHTDLNPR